MRLEPNTERAARVLRKSLSTESSAVLSPDEIAIVGAMTRAVERRVRRKRERALAWGCAAAAAAVGVFFVGRQWQVKEVSTGPVTLTLETSDSAGSVISRDRTEHSLSGPAMLREGDGVRTDELHSVRLTLSTGTRMTLAKSGRLSVAQLGASQRFRLGEGRFTADVAPLSTGQRFVVETPDAEVEVHGTSFEVSVESAPSTCATPAKLTTVFVREGQVSVRHHGDTLLLGRGSSWSDTCDRQIETQAATQVVAPERAPPRESPRRAHVAPAVHSDTAVSHKTEPAAPAASAPSLSRLDEQNDLFAAALTAERRKDYEGALRSLDELLAGFPGGPLSEGARVVRLRVVEQRSRLHETTSVVPAAGRH